MSKAKTKASPKTTTTRRTAGKPANQAKRRVLNVGGGNKNIPIPAQYDGWEHLLLDIDPKGNPDIICDARQLTTLEPGQYDAIYCSHNLEHYYSHDVNKVLQGFLHILKDDGFAHIRVPDMQKLMQVVVEKNLDIEDILYQAPAGPIMVRDVIYGYGREIEQSGHDFYAHKTGFTPKSLQRILAASGFAFIGIGTADLEIIGIGFKSRPSEYTQKLFNFSMDGK